ncbi:SusC/RagA family TonB-linked outer membrane protein [Mucilaginibacter aquatilis]|uniref:SusC/RagA family TonB-linked outer membrane protein n=1 Tax=Mucilaginibacter aquatilis TaxID=1517760 RepID=A0A6I4I9T7_9SPHI|nr:TonB-dependent receptor [Mucilaginibacter aquatilis]MVN91822.1 SusC/RagA family TonB-linked outer membrane protein [Mucilaginibacter aquatilis]
MKKLLHRSLLKKHVKGWCLSLLVLVTALGHALAQNTVIVSGTVRDEKSKEALPGVIISASASKKGTATDVNGKFTLQVQQGEQLSIRSVGYQETTVVAGSQTDFNITLAPTQTNLNDVVVVGYGTQRKVDLTGAVSQVAGSELSRRPVTSVGSALQGQMPGVTVNVQRGLPGNNGGTIRIRGIGTLGNANPLLVIDGVQAGDINILNPEDIESVSVLKDAASASIYGVRGSNGVILITTKKGAKNAEPTLSYNNYFGFQKPTALPKYLGSPQYMELLNEARVNAGLNPTYTPEQIEIARNGSDPNFFANTDWINEIFKNNAPQQNHNLNLSGGSNKTNYYLSYGYLKEGGFITGDVYGAKRHTIRTRVTSTLFDRLDIDASIGYIDRAYSESNESTGAGAGPLSVAQYISPLVPVRFTNGSWGYGGGSRNPLAVVTDGGYNDFSSQEITANIQTALHITKDFRLRAQYGLVRSNSLREIFTKTIDYVSPVTDQVIYQTNFPNRFSNADYTRTYQMVNARAEYEKTFVKKHYVKAFVGVQREEDINKNFDAYRTYFPTQDVANLSLGSADNQFNNGSADQDALQSVFGRVNYSFNQRYLFEGNFRFDASSKFIKELRWDNFLSASAGWVFSEESFFAPLRKIIDIGKIRVSYGSQGNDNISSSSYMKTYSAVATMPIGNTITSGFRESRIANPLLRWEAGTKQDIGIDLSMLNGRLGVTADYYINNTNGILLPVPLPGVLGGAFPQQNAGKVQNKGWELSLTYRDKIDDFTYNLSANLSDVKNKVVSLGGTIPTFGDQVRILNQPIDSFYGYVADRLAQESDFTVNPNNPIATRYTPNFPFDSSFPMRPGDVIYKDLNGDGKITADGDRQVIGNPIPRYTYAFTGNFGYKSFDLTIFLQGVGKASGYVNGAARHAFINDASSPQEFHLDRWTPTNTGASYPRLAYGFSYNQRLSTKWLEDASYFRVKNIQLGYTLPKSFTEKIRVSRLRVYASADNLFTATNFFYGYDPETPVTAGGFYPVPKTIVFGLNLSFK